jgi:3-hydroxyisobutyrate dehydrogenase-like beta-hydroxyacid dehydrogenase
MSMRVGFVGLGDQGLPMAQRVVAAGLPTALWARRPASVEPFLGTAATIAGSPRELGAVSDIVATCVFDGAGTREILFGPAGILAGMTRGGVVVVHSTIAPEEIIEIAAVARESGITVLDAPVSGGHAMAEQGRLVALVGGDRDACERCLPVLSSYADQVIHVGRVGAGQQAKLINNALMAAQLGLAADAFELGGELGIDPDGLARALRQGSGRSYSLDVMVRSGSLDVLARGPAGPTLAKDVRLLARTTAGRADFRRGLLLVAARAAIDMIESRVPGRA